MSECKGIAGWLFGHAYEACYSESLPEIQSLKTLETTVRGFERAMEALKSSTYERHICRRCGSVIEKEHP